MINMSEWAQNDRNAWTRGGKPETMVEESSAVLYVPNETRIPVMADHTGMIKFSHRDRHYHAVKTQLNEVMKNCSDTISQRFALPIERYI